MRSAVNPLSFDEHRELGRELLKSSARLRELAVVVTAAYGVDSPAATQFHQLNDALDRLRDQMESQARQDFPGAETAMLYR